MTSKNTVLLEYWLKIQNELGSSQRTPNKVVRKVLSHLRRRTQPANCNAEHQSSGVFLLTTLPKEMWFMILSYISEYEDLMSCAGTCTLFKIIVDEMKTKRLFKGILPHLSEYLDRNEILGCRLVCKQWHADVCSFAKTDSEYNEPPQNECRDLEVAKYLHKVPKQIDILLRKFQLPKTHFLGRDSRFFSSTREDMNLQSQNPFLGGQVVVLWIRTSNPDEPNFCTVMKTFLDEYGRHLTSLQLAVIGTYEPADFRDAFALVVHVFKKCPQLRRFGITRKFHRPIEDDLRDSVVEMNPLPDHSCIRCIDIRMKDQPQILLPLLKKYSNQLCRLNFVVDICSAKFLSTLPWANLTDLQTMEYNSLEFANAGTDLNAPQLRHMSVSFHLKDVSLTNFLQGINSFPKLTSLKIGTILIGEMSLPEEEEIISVPTDIICRSSITSLEIELEDLSFSMDFLVCFPLLRKLVFVYFPVLNRPKRINKKEIKRGKLVRIFEYADEAVPPAAGLERFIEAMCLYRSNIWEILPFLQTLQVSGWQVEDKVFTRSGYRASRYYKTWPNGFKRFWQ